MIPEIIHQIWLGPLPPPAKLIRSWRIKNPRFRHILWTEENIHSVRNHVQFDAAKSYSIKSDILRYEILYRYGGWYMDADSYCLKSICPLSFYDMVTVREPTQPKRYANGIIGISSKHPAMRLAIEHIAQLPPKERYHWKETGPGIWTIIANHFRATVLEADSFLPYSFTDIHWLLRGREIEKKDLSESYALQLWCGTTRSYKKWEWVLSQLLK